MNVRVLPLWTPKAGCSEDEYEDAFYPVRPRLARGTSFLAAVADGATEASFARLWARLLAEAYGRGRLRAPRFADDLAPLAQAWVRQTGSRATQWYSIEKASQGAFAAMVGVRIWERPRGRCRVRGWEAVAVGDSCILHIRRGALLRAFPVEASCAFGRSPQLIGSVQPPCGAAAAPTTASGFWEPGDVFLLVSDAVAEWLLRGSEHGESPWEGLLALRGRAAQATFRESVRSLRAGRTLRNDDATVLRLSLL